jgi:hypothetical protein
MIHKNLYEEPFTTEYGHCIHRNLLWGEGNKRGQVLCSHVILWYVHYIFHEVVYKKLTVYKNLNDIICMR